MRMGITFLGDSDWERLCNEFWNVLFPDLSADHMSSFTL